jgi:diguanylate cyclase (GGDEF)-like protein
MSSALVVQDEFGPLGLLSTIAHGYYINGVATEAVAACANWLVVARAVGAEVTVRYLLYVQAISLIDLGRYSEALEVGSELLESLGTEPEPAWRCKSLAVIAESTVRMNKPSGAIAPLAEADWLLRAVDRTSYPYLSASMAVALALRSANLVEPSDAILGSIRGGGEPELEMLIAQEAALLSAHWGTVLMLIGRPDDAGVQFRAATTRALKMQRWARLAGNTAMAARGQVIEAYGMLHLGEEPLAVARARAAAAGFVARPELIETRLLHLVLGTARTPADLREAREHLHTLLRDAESSDPTWAAAGRAALAVLDAIEHGESEGTRMWREVAQDALRSVWDEREARFAALRDQESIRHLTAQADQYGREILEDPLTGLGNRRLLARIAREPKGLEGAVFIDVDEFKAVNDRYSHAVGDSVLRTMAAILRAQSRAGDQLLRYGGDEFVVLPLGGPDAARAVARRIHAAVLAHPWGDLAPDLAVTVSVGVGSADTDDLLLSADRALLTAKRAGRNQVVAAG